jgi:hypothetical protein
MMNQLERLAHLLGLKKSGDTLFGFYGKFPITIKSNNQADIKRVQLSLAGGDIQTVTNLTTRLDGIKELVTVFMDNDRLAFSLSSENNSEWELKNAIDDILKELQVGGFDLLCGYCGHGVPESFFRVNGTILPVCQGCVAKNKTSSPHRAASNAMHFFKGSLGAFLGAIAGSVVWILIGLFGFYASIAGMAMVYASWFGFRLFGGKISKAAIFVIGISVLVAVVFSELFGLGIDIVKYYRSEGLEYNILNVLLAIFLILSGGGEAIVPLILNGLLGLVFAGLGSFGLLKKLSKESKQILTVFEEIKS